MFIQEHKTQYELIHRTKYGTYKSLVLWCKGQLREMFKWRYYTPRYNRSYPY